MFKNIKILLLVSLFCASISAAKMESTEQRIARHTFFHTLSTACNAGIASLGAWGFKWVLGKKEFQNLYAIEVSPGQLLIGQLVLGSSLFIINEYYTNKSKYSYLFYVENLEEEELRKTFGYKPANK